MPPPATTVPPTAVSPTAVPPTAVPPISTGVPPTATTQPSTSGAPNLGPSDCSNWPPVASSGDPATSAAQAAANGQCDGRDYDSVIDQCFWRDANEFGTHVQGWQCIIYGSTDGEPTAVPPTSEPPTDVTPTAVPPTDGAPNLGRDECSNWPPVASSGDPASSAARSAANAQCEGRDYDSAIDQCFWRNANEFGTHVQGWQCIITNVSGDDDDDEPDSELIPGLGAGECSNWPPVVSSGNPATSAAQSAATAQCGGRDYDDAVDQCFWRDENELGTHAQGWQCIISAPPVDDPVTDPGSDPNTGSSTGLRMTGVRFNSSNNTLEWDIPVNPPFEIRQFRIIKNNHDNNGDIYLDVPGALNTESGYNILGTKYTYSLADLTPGTSYTIMAYYDEGGGTRTWGPKSAYATVHGANQSAPRIPPFGERSNFQAAHSFLAGAWRVDFDEEFRGNTNQQLSDRGSANGGQRWFFGGPPGSDLQLAGSRLIADRLHATLDGSDRGILSMDVDVASSRYSYLATADDNPNNDTDEGNEEYYLDPASELFLEASVRLDHAAPAYNAWWAFWLMAPGTHNCDGELSGSNVAHNAYDGQAETGTEIDIFELVPDNGNGFNAAIFKSHKGFFQCKKDENGSVVDSTLETETEVIRPTTGDFSYFTPGDINGHIFNYMDGQFHNIGLYYSADRLAFFVDDILIWETQNTDFITDQARESIRLTWEVDNSNVWGIRRDSQSTFAERTRFDRLLLANEVPDNPTVYVDYVKVWQKAVRTAPVGTAEEQRSDALTQAVKALESYAAKSGTFAVAGGGFEGSGEGWYLFNGDPDHPKSIVSVLVDEGYLNEKDLIKDPLHVGTGSTVGDLRVYACKDRVAVFSDQGTESASAADSLWWDENECSREPIEAFDATYFKLSRTLASVQEPLRVFLPVSFD